MKSPTSTASPATHAPSLSSQSYLSLQKFKKGIKRDPSTFDTLKDERYDDVFHHGFTTTARAQGLSNICDPK